MIAESAVADPFRATDSLAFASREANVDPPRRDLGIFLLAHEVEFGGADDTDCPEHGIISYRPARNSIRSALTSAGRSC